MTAAIFKLESFDRPTTLPAQAGETFDRDDLDQAFADGFSAGKAEGDQLQLERLEGALSQLSALLTDEDARRAALRAEAVSALSPILSHAMDLMAPKAQSHRLEEALIAEMTRIAGRAVPLKARIVCPPPLLDFVRQCSSAANPAIEVDCRDGADLEIVLEGGRIDISPDRIAAEVAALLAEINEENPEWTR